MTLYNVRILLLYFHNLRNLKEKKKRDEEQKLALTEASVNKLKCETETNSDYAMIFSLEVVFS